MDQHATGPKGSDGDRQPADVQWPRELQATADADVDSIIGDLTRLPGIPVAEQAPVFERIHDDLLAGLDAGAD